MVFQAHQIPVLSIAGEVVKHSLNVLLLVRPNLATASSHSTNVLISFPAEQPAVPAESNSYVHTVAGNAVVLHVSALLTAQWSWLVQGLTTWPSK